tara:strand:- start:5911 stop:6927 length:1017 start_codon:yes stop_codon:yes gene_type:complete
MSGKVLITGITGQDGAYLAKSLLDDGFEVFGGVRRGSVPKTYRLDYLGITEKVNFTQLEITEFANVQKVLREIEPSYIYNLAAQSFVGDSFVFPHFTSQVNYLGLLNILETIRVDKMDVKVYQASTSEMFGEVLEKPQTEKTPFNPISPYGISKLAAHHLVKNYRQAYDIYACSGILFNHESELRGLEFVSRKITNWLAKIKKLNFEPLALGNLDSIRDWGYAPEYVDMMIKMLKAENPDDYVISTNTEYSVRDFLKFAAAYMDFDLVFEGKGIEEIALDRKTGKKIAFVSEKYFRASDVVYLRGDNTKAKKILNWKPKILAPKIAEKMANYDLSLIK